MQFKLEMLSKHQNKTFHTSMSRQENKFDGNRTKIFKIQLRPFLFIE